MATKEARHDANYQTIRNFIKNETQGFSITNGEYSLEYLTKFFVIKGDQAIHHLYIERKLLDDNNSQELLVFLKMFDLAGYIKDTEDSHIELKSNGIFPKPCP